MSNFEKICRACLSGGELQSLFVEDYDHFPYLIVDMLNHVTNVQVIKDDHFPQNICIYCLEKLKSAYDFVQQCQDVNSKLIKQVNTQNDCKLEKTYDEVTEISLKIKSFREYKKKFTSFPNYEFFIDNTEFIDDIVDIKSDKPYDFVDIKSDIPDDIVDIKPEITDDIEDIKPDLDRNNCEKEFPKNIRKRVYTYRNVKCNICSKIMLNCNLRRHLKTHTGERPFLCSMCGKGFIRKASLQTHMLNHTSMGERSFDCILCRSNFKYGTQLSRHINVKHAEEIKPIPDGELECDKCGEKFSNQNILALHQMLHWINKTTKSFLCNFCGKDFSTNLTLQDHLASHTGEKRYKCDTCEESFSNYPAFHTHRKMHLDEKPYKCDTCEKIFTHYRTLHTHRKTHLDEKPYKCRFCEKSFVIRKALSVHESMHTGDKPFKCKICNQSFRQRTHLKYHSYTHTGEKRYKCTYCNKAFALNTNLTVHIRIHTGETPYVCSICKKGFYSSSSMKQHKRKHLLVDNIKTEQVSN